MPTLTALQPLSDEERSYREAVIRDAQEQLLEPVGSDGESVAPLPGV